MLFVQCSLHICLLQENIWTVPNLLSLLRISAAPLLGWCVLGGHHVAAVSIFVLAGLSDWVRRSVYSATNWDQHSYMQNAPLSPPPIIPSPSSYYPSPSPHHPSPSTHPQLLFHPFEDRWVHCSQCSWAALLNWISPGSTGRQAPRLCSLCGTH